MRQRPLATVLLAAVLVVTGFPRAFAQTPESDEPQVGVPVTGNNGVQETVEQLMEREAAKSPRVKPRILREQRDSQGRRICFGRIRTRRGVQL